MDTLLVGLGLGYIGFFVVLGLGYIGYCLQPFAGNMIHKFRMFLKKKPNKGNNGKTQEFKDWDSFLLTLSQAPWHRANEELLFTGSIPVEHSDFGPLLVTRNARDMWEKILGPVNFDWIHIPPPQLVKVMDTEDDYQVTTYDNLCRYDHVYTKIRYDRDIYLHWNITSLVEEMTTIIPFEPKQYNSVTKPTQPSRILFWLQDEDDIVAMNKILKENTLYVLEFKDKVIVSRRFEHLIISELFGKHSQNWFPVFNDELVETLEDFLEIYDFAYTTRVSNVWSFQWTSISPKMES